MELQGDFALKWSYKNESQEALRMSIILSDVPARNHFDLWRERDPARERKSSLAFLSHLVFSLGFSERSYDQASPRQHTSYSAASCASLRHRLSLHLAPLCLIGRSYGFSLAIGEPIALQNLTCPLHLIITSMAPSKSPLRRVALSRLEHRAAGQDKGIRDMA